MNIVWDNLQKRIEALPNQTTFAHQHGIASLDCFAIDQLLPPNSGQHAMRNALAALGYDFGEDEEVHILSS